jgi:signal transduction histidine kinase
MLTVLSLLVGICAVAIFLAGVLALLRNSSQASNRWFFRFTSFVAIWMPFNYYDSNYIVHFWTSTVLKLDFISALFLGWAFMQFVDTFANDNFQSSVRPNRYSWWLFGANILAIPAVTYNLLFTSSINGKTLSVNYKQLFIAYVSLIGFYFIYGIAKLYFKRRHAKANDKPALNFIFVGVVIAIVANIFTNLIFPIFIHSRSIVEELNLIGYLGLLIFILFVYIAITTRKLFDIRILVARSLGYFLALLSIGSLFILLSYGITDILFKHVNSDGDRLFYAFLAVGLSMLFSYLKHFFDKATNKLFYRDIYDTQSLLDNLNKLLVSTYELKPLLNDSANIIIQNIKPNFFQFYIYHMQAPIAEKNAAILKSNINHKDLNSIRDMSNGVSEKIIVSDDLNDSFSPLKTLLQKHNIAILAKLSSSNHEEGIGYMLLGYKKSGNTYSTQDTKVLEIIANELVIAIQNSLRFQEIQNFNATLQQRINDATRKLRRTNDKLKALDETKDDFISLASHQLRTPLTSIKGYLSMISEGDAGKLNKTQKVMIDQAYISSQRMVYLIADMLNVSRLKTGKFAIQASPVSLADMVGQELSQLKQTAASRGLNLIYDKPKNFPLLMLDETKIRQVVMNFSDNAIYYTPAKGTIEVQVINKPSVIEFRVKDDGIGVPASEKHHLFTKFYRAKNARRARPDGTGLGLYMARKVIVAQGGAIIFESKEGKGSTFGFVLNKAKLMPPENPPTSTTATINNNQAQLSNKSYRPSATLK